MDSPHTQPGALSMYKELNSPFKPNQVLCSSRLYKAVCIAFPNREVIPFDFKLGLYGLRDTVFRYFNHNNEMRLVDTADGSIWAWSERKHRYNKLRTSRWFIVKNQTHATNS